MKGLALVQTSEAGYTGISVGKVDERYVMLPIHSIVDKGARKARHPTARSSTGLTH